MTICLKLSNKIITFSLQVAEALINPFGEDDDDFGKNIPRDILVVIDNLICFLSKHSFNNLHNLHIIFFRNELGDRQKFPSFISDSG